MTPPILCRQVGDNHLQSVAAAAVPEESEYQVSELTEALVSSRMAELFADGSGVPCVPPKQPPVVEKPTKKLCWLALEASEDVKRVQGKLGGYDAIGYVIADLLGRSLLLDEALLVGTSARGYALRAKEAEKVAWSNASARRSKLRLKARKDPSKVPDLDEQLVKIDRERDAACADLWREEVDLNGMPAANTVIVEQRAPAPAPAPARDLPREPAPETMCARARAFVDIAMSEEAAAAITAAFHVAFLSQGGRDPYFDCQLEIAQVCYKHALRRLKASFPGELCSFSENSARDMVNWMVRLHATGFCVPAAERAAEKVAFNLPQAAADMQARMHAMRSSNGKCEQCGSEACTC